MNLRDLDVDETTRAVAAHGVPPDVARRIFARVHRDGAVSLSGVRGLPRAAERSIAAEAEWPDLEIVDRRRAADGFVKYLFRMPDRVEVEAVRIPLPASASAAALAERRRAGVASGLVSLPTAKYTLCLSSQAGCALACAFCATGRLGGIRNLRTWEILAQFRLIAAESDHPIRGVVFMGMGEPFLNYEAVMTAAGVMCDPAGPAIAARSITISTAGVVPQIRRFAAERHRYRLIVSLGAPGSDERLRLMPIEGRWPLPELMAAVREYASGTTQRVTIAYVLIAGPDGNATPRHARELGALLAGIKCRLNLIDVQDPGGPYRAPTSAEFAAFRDALDPLGIPIVRRYSGGGDVEAACGTLSASRRGGIGIGGQGARPDRD